MLDFYRERWESGPAVLGALGALPFQKYLALGGMSLKMSTTTADVDQWQKLFGVSYEALDQSALPLRASSMVHWSGKPGQSDYVIKDERVSEAIAFLVAGGHGSFDFEGEKTTSLARFVLQLAMYFAALDIASEYGITFMGIKCQDELGYFTHPARRYPVLYLLHGVPGRRVPQQRRRPRRQEEAHRSGGLRERHGFGADPAVPSPALGHAVRVRGLPRRG